MDAVSRESAPMRFRSAPSSRRISVDTGAADCFRGLPGTTPG
ncbi:hypothetical protein FF36_05104 [Frankia torreyi]|uniref:Uncharacterized protein n=1 Tax=Frankia torreyi TaxID=1856 RepID=A0A0D8B9I2_9ACTN|nr:hypothetical protein FF36_05104 [Frankia torreyi]KQM02923.1 hypothetical protein FF86_105221 [Frankia sp. CpI1-P]